MVAEEPLEAGHHAVLLLISTLIEVPDAGSTTDDELSASNQEGVDPEESEDVVDEHVAGLVKPHDLSHKFVADSWSGVTNSPHEESADEPDESPDGHDQVGKTWKNKDAHVVLHKLGGSLEHGDTELDGTVAAAHSDKDDERDGPENVGSPCEVLVLWLFGKVSLLGSVVEGIKTSKDQGQLSNDESDPDDRSTNNSDDK